MDLPCEAPSDMQSGEGKPLGDSREDEAERKFLKFRSDTALLKLTRKLPFARREVNDDLEDVLQLLQEADAKMKKLSERFQGGIVDQETAASVKECCGNITASVESLQQAR